MQAAFGLLEAGSVQHKNSLNIMMKNMADLTVGGVAWWAVGYWIAFRPQGGHPFVVNDYSFWFFQWTFAATASTIDSGAVAERISFLPYCMVSCLVSGLIYPMAAFHTWHEDGSLARLGFHDFAGGGAVHLLGGTVAVVCCTVLGPRIGRFEDFVPSRSRIAQFLCRRPCDPDYYVLAAGKARLFSVSDPVSMLFGVFFLWVGWYGFNLGSTGGTHGANTYVSGLVTVNTTLGALGGAFFTFLHMLVFERQTVTPVGMALGVLAGLVSITAGCPWFRTGIAFLVGFLGALLATMSQKLLEWARIDDVVAAIPIHAVTGAFGVVAVGLFAEPWSCNPAEQPLGIFFASRQDQGMAWRFLGVQLLGCVCIVACAGSAMLLIVAVMNQVRCLRLRVSRDRELCGIDEGEHSLQHESVDFQDTLMQLIDNVAGSAGCVSEIVQAFARANRCLNLSSCMAAEKQQRLEMETQSGVNLQIVVKSAVGLPHEGLAQRPMLQTLSSFSGKDIASTVRRKERQNRGSFVVIEVVSAPGQVIGSWVRERDFSMFTPRYTSLAQPDACDSVVEWGETFTFENLYFPAGSEDTIFAIFTVFTSGLAIGQACTHLAPQRWPLDIGQELNTQSVQSLQLFANRQVDEPLGDARLTVHLSYARQREGEGSFMVKRLQLPEERACAESEDVVRENLPQAEALEMRLVAMERRISRLEGEKSLLERQGLALEAQVSALKGCATASVLAL